MARRNDADSSAWEQADQHRCRIYGFIANIYFYEIETPLRQFVVSHENIARYCRAIHDAVMAKPA